MLYRNKLNKSKLRVFFTRDTGIVVFSPTTLTTSQVFDKHSVTNELNSAKKKNARKKLSFP